MEMEAVANIFDRDGDGFVDYKEFVSALRPNRDVSTRIDTYHVITCFRAPDKIHIFIFIMHIYPPNAMFDLLLESSHRDDSNKWPNIAFG